MTPRNALSVAVWPLVALAVIPACRSQKPADVPQVLKRIDLPAPRTKSEVSLEEAIAKRRSVRSFADRPLTWDEISQLAWAAQGITDRKRGFRAAPSAGALYPLEMYMVTREGTFHYLPDEHAMEKLSGEDLRGALSAAALNQAWVAQAAMDVVLTAVYARTRAKYGDRAERYVHMEAGHVGQNILLQAVALGLGAVPVGAFDDSAVARVLDLPEDHEPVYIIPVGRPR